MRGAPRAGLVWVPRARGFWEAAGTCARDRASASLTAATLLRVCPDPLVCALPGYASENHPRAEGQDDQGREVHDARLPQGQRGAAALIRGGWGRRSPVEPLTWNSSGKKTCGTTGSRCSGGVGSAWGPCPC